MKTARILSVANQKGGVGKTTSVINLAASISVHDLDILIIDMDPQANATSGLGLEEESEYGTNGLISGNCTLDESIVPTEMEGFFAVRGSRDLAGLEIELAAQNEREFFLKRALESDALGKFPWVLIDCPPSLGLLTLNALVASSGVLLPLQSEYYALEGLSHLFETIGSVRRLWNPGLAIHGVFLTMYDRRLRLSREVEQDAETNLGNMLFRTRIPRNVRLSEAPSYGRPVLLYDAFSTGARSYMSLAREVIAR
jgi:chromosome partitioning protein